MWEFCFDINLLSNVESILHEISTSCFYMTSMCKNMNYISTRTKLTIHTFNQQDLNTFYRLKLHFKTLRSTKTDNSAFLKCVLYCPFESPDVWLKSIRHLRDFACGNIKLFSLYI